MVTLKVYSLKTCQPCQQLKRTLATNDLGVPVTTVDVDAWKEEAQADQVRAVPTLILLENGVEVKRTTGAKTLDQLKDFIKI